MKPSWYACAIIGAGAIALLPQPAPAAQFYGDQARQVMGLLQSGRGACFVTRSVVNPVTNIVEQAFCQCVASVDGTASNQAGQVEAINTTLGPEQPCAAATAGPTPQQRQNASARVGQIDNDLSQWDQYLQNLWSHVDRYAYANDPNYRAQADAWVRDWGNYGAWVEGQLRAERAGQVSIANAPAGGPTGVGGPAGGGAPPGTAVPGSSTGLLGIPME